MAPPVAVSPSPSTTTEPHPALVQIARILARQVAQADIAAHNSLHREDSSED